MAQAKYQIRSDDAVTGKYVDEADLLEYDHGEARHMSATKSFTHWLCIHRYIVLPFTIFLGLLAYLTLPRPEYQIPQQQHTLMISIGKGCQEKPILIIHFCFTPSHYKEKENIDRNLTPSVQGLVFLI